MLVVNRFRVVDEEAFLDRLESVLGVLGSKPGFVGEQRGQNLDEPDLWVLVTTWENVGSYRRAIGSYDAKVVLAALMGELVHEASAYDYESGKP